MTQTRIDSLAIGRVDGRPVALFGDRHGRIGHWDPAASGPGERLEAHEQWVRAIRVVDVDGRAVAVTAGGETVRFWDFATLEALHAPFPTHIWTEALGVAVCKDTPLAVWRSSNNRVTAVDLRTFEPVMEGSPDWTLAAAFYGVGGEVYAILEDHPFDEEADDYDFEEISLQVWDFAEGRQIGGALVGGGFGGTVTRTPLALLDGVGGAVLASGAGPDGALRLWRLPEGTAVGEPRPAHDQISCVAADGDWIVTGGTEGRVRLWDAAGQGGTVVHDGGHKVNAVAVVGTGGGGRPRVLAAFDDGSTAAI